MSAAAAAILVMCPLLIGLLSGAVLTYLGYIYVMRASPVLFGATMGNALRALSLRLGRAHCHVVDAEGIVHAVPTESICLLLEREVPLWLEQRQRGLS